MLTYSSGDVDAVLFTARFEFANGRHNVISSSITSVFSLLVILAMISSYTKLIAGLKTAALLHT